jgi:hypothetical protein
VKEMFNDYLNTYFIWNMQNLLILWSNEACNEEYDYAYNGVNHAIDENDWVKAQSSITLLANLSTKLNLSIFKHMISKIHSS